MLDFIKCNLVTVDKEDVDAGHPAVKIDDTLFLLQRNDTPKGSGMDFYKCAAVAGGSSDISSTDIFVRGFSDESFNGIYSLLDSTATGIYRVWVKDDIRIQTEMDTDENVAMWRFLTDEYNNVDNPCIAHSHMPYENPWDTEEWFVYTDFHGISGKPVVSLTDISSGGETPSLVPNTWSGHKAVLKTETTTTEGETVVVVSGAPIEEFNGTYYHKDNFEGWTNAWVMKDNIHHIVFEADEWYIRNSDGGFYYGVVDNGADPWTCTYWEDMSWNHVASMTVTQQTTEGTSETKKYYTFEETLTEGMTYGNGFTPEVGKVYDSEAMIEVANLWTNYIPMPTDGLIFYTPLKEQKSSDELGIPLNYYGSAKQSYVYDDELKQTVCKFEGGVIATPTDQYVLPKQITMSMWVKAFTNTSGIWALNMQKQSSAKAYQLRTNSVAVWNNSYDQEFSLPESNDRTKWHHYLMTCDGQTLYGYLDGSLVVSQQCSTSSFRDSDYAPISIGTNESFSDNSADFEGYITAVRVYNRALSDDEIKLLSTEFAK